MPEVVTIPRAEYEFLKKCEKVLYEEFNEEFIKKVSKAQMQLEKGKGILCKSKVERSRYFESL
ncbi:MAG: hypothetical protein BME93_03475 [Methanosarcinales archaeon Met12]|nr:MAG: hypothetical protein BME93_03475 [Methanosarcinales archaeon Met12]